MKKSIVSIVVAAALVIGGLTVYASGEAQRAAETEAVEKAKAEKEVAELKAELASIQRKTEAAEEAKEQAEAEAKKKAEEEAAAKKKAEEEAAAKKKAEEEAAAQKKAEEEAAAAAEAQRQAEAAAAAQSTVQTAAPVETYNVAPVEPAVNTEPVYQPLCPNGHPICSGNMCGYADCPNSYCYVNNNTYTNNAGTDYNYSGGNGYQGG